MLHLGAEPLLLPSWRNKFSGSLYSCVHPFIPPEEQNPRRHPNMDVSEMLRISVKCNRPSSLWAKCILDLTVSVLPRARVQRHIGDPGIEKGWVGWW